MTTIKKETKGEVKEKGGKSTSEQSEIIDRFDAGYRTAEALLQGIYGISTSEMCEESWPSVELLIYEIENHMEEIKKAFEEATGQTKRNKKERVNE